MRWFGNYVRELLIGPWPELYFIRHGHGIHQLAHDLVKAGQAKTPREALGFDIPNHLVPLSALGRHQANLTRFHIGFAPDCVYTSQLRRAEETARLIFPTMPPRVDPRLNEKDFGPGHLMGDEELDERFPHHAERYDRDGKYFAAKAPGGENYPQMYLRMHSMLDTLRRDWAGKRVAVVCHSALMMVVRQLFERHLPQELLQLARREWVENCGILHYVHPTEVWGWEQGKFRLRLAKPPYDVWRSRVDSQAEQQLISESMLEVERLRAKVAAAEK